MTASDIPGVLARLREATASDAVRGTLRPDILPDRFTAHPASARVSPFVLRAREGRLPAKITR